VDGPVRECMGRWTCVLGAEVIEWIEGSVREGMSGWVGLCLRQ
jgi:hypothetical protein